MTPLPQTAPHAADVILRLEVFMPRRLPPLITPALLLMLLGCRDSVEPTPMSDAGADAASEFLKFVQVSVGEARSCGVTTTHEAYCWGSKPTRVPGGLAFRQVSARGRFHACGVTMDDAAYCWGINALGQLGDGTETDSDEPVPVAGGHAFRKVAVGTLHSCGITRDDVAYCWGHNQAGELGVGTQDTEFRPTRVAGRLAFRELSAGEQLTCGLTLVGVAYCWGENTLGQLGQGTDEGPESCFTGDSLDPCSTRPVRVLRGLRFAHISVGNAHVCGVTADGRAFCWGANDSGQLGHRTSSGPELCQEGSPCSTTPIRVGGKLAFAAVDGGGSHTCGLTSAGKAYCWGSNRDGELGTGNPSDLERCDGAPRCSTRPLAVLGNLQFRTVQAGLAHTCAVRVGGLAYCWGRNDAGQLGDGTTHRRLRPRRVSGPT